MTVGVCTFYELNGGTIRRIQLRTTQMVLVLCFTCPFQIASDRWSTYKLNTVSLMGPSCAWSICPTFAAAILHKNDKQLLGYISLHLILTPIYFFSNVTNKLLGMPKYFITVTMLAHNLSPFYYKIGLQMQNTMGPNIFS